MDRRDFFRRAPRPAPETPPFEVLPGVFVPDGPVDWHYRADRPADDATARRAGRPALPTASGLDPFTPSASAPWDAARVRHLLRRTGVAAPVELVQAFAARSPAEAVDLLVDGVRATGADPDPEWIDDAPPRWTEPQSVIDAYWDENWVRFEQLRNGILMDLMGRAADSPEQEAVRSFRHRLCWMWANHFVTHRQSYRITPWLVRHWQTMQRNALGNVRPFVDEIGLDPAMLVYLNGIENRVGAPNENYARELLELFTMGITGPDGTPNYTQDDIAAISRALTGWGLDYYGETETPLEPVFIPDWHDTGEKTIFGQSGAWGYADVVRIVFEERSPEIAHWIATVLYREFVYDVPHPDVVGALADVLLDADFEIAPAVRTLLQSEHFFDAAVLGARVRSPLEVNIGTHRGLGYAASSDHLGGVHYTMRLSGQVLFQPPTVAGWPGGRDWLDTSRLTARWLYASWVVWQQDRFRALAAAMPDPWDPARLAADLADHLLGVPLDAAAAEALTPILLNGIPAYEWNPTVEGAESRIRQLVSHLLRLPEYQLS